MPRTGRHPARRVRLPPAPRHVHLNAAGIDVGAGSHHVAIPPGRDPEGRAVREFGAFTADLFALAEWLRRCGIETVAMESTGVYWIPLFELLAARGFEVRLVDPRQLRNVPGRKSDVLDCQWIQQLHTFGLLAAAFRPDDQICVLRSYLRQRAMLVTYAAHHVQHVQKALEQMNVKLARVVSHITGVTGRRILRAVLDGERDPRVLARLRDRRCQHDEETIARSLEGTWRAEHLFALWQAVELLDFYQQQIVACDREIEVCLGGFADKTAGHTLPAKPRTTKPTGRPPPSMSAPTSIASRASISSASTASTRPPPSKSSRRPASTCVAGRVTNTSPPG